MLFRLLIALPMLLSAASAQARWKEATSNNFIVYGEMSSERLEKTVADLEKYHFMLRTVSGAKAPPSPIRIKIYLMQNIGAVADSLPYDVSGIAGYYTTTPRGPIAVSTRVATGGQFGLGAQQVLFHELAHHFMNQYFPAAYPPWYSEGFADYYGTARILDRDVIEVGHPVENRYLSLSGNDWLPLDKVLTARSYGDVSGRLDLLYAQGWLLVHYLANDKARSGQLRDYLTAINSGRSYEQAMESAFGPGAKALNEELQAYARRRKLMALALPFKPITVGDIAIAELSPARDALIEHEIALGSGVLKRTAAQFAASVRKVAARFPDDPYALRILTEAERSAGNSELAGKAVDRWLSLAPGDPLAMMHKGALQVEALRSAGARDSAAWAKAREPIFEAHKAAPGNPEILIAYYDSFAAQGMLPPAGAQNGLVAAFEALPQDSAIRYKLASDFEQRGLIEDAIAVITPAALELRSGADDEKEKKKQDLEREKYRKVGDDTTETPREMLLRLEKKLASAKPS